MRSVEVRDLERRRRDDIARVHEVVLRRLLVAEPPEEGRVQRQSLVWRSGDGDAVEDQDVADVEAAERELLAPVLAQARVDPPAFG